MVDNIFYAKAIQQLRPGEGFALDDMDYSTLKFTNDVEAPTEEEINVVFQQLKTAYINAEYQRKRVLEYPSIEDYIDGIVKGDEAQVQEYIDKCLAVKAKYPKYEEIV